MQTGGTDKYCQMNSSGLPHSGCNPRSSQSFKYKDEDEMEHNVRCTHLVTYPSEKIQYLQRAQFFVYCFIDIYCQFFLRLDCGCERLLPLFHLLCRLLCTKFVVNNFQGSCLLDSSIGRRTIRAMHDLTRHTVDCFRQ